MYKIIVSEHGKTIMNVNFHTVEAAWDAARSQIDKGREVEICDMETSRMMLSDCPAAVALR
jgi:hypothetical protein